MIAHDSHMTNCYLVCNGVKLNVRPRMLIAKLSNILGTTDKLFADVF